ncbi:uncharacterized protein BDCG_17275, partial [Blastomyces dermatitidis ER-3]
VPSTKTVPCSTWNGHAALARHYSSLQAQFVPVLCVRPFKHFSPPPFSPSSSPREHHGQNASNPIILLLDVNDDLGGKVENAALIINLLLILLQNPPFTFSLQLTTYRVSSLLRISHRNL